MSRCLAGPPWSVIVWGGWSCRWAVTPSVAPPMRAAAAARANSLTGDIGSVARNKADAILTAGDVFESIGTFCYEGVGTEAVLFARLTAVLALLSGLPGGVTLNHVWQTVD